LGTPGGSAGWTKLHSGSDRRGHASAAGSEQNYRNTGEDTHACETAFGGVPGNRGGLNQIETRRHGRPTGARPVGCLAWQTVTAIFLNRERRFDPCRGHQVLSYFRVMLRVMLESM
jgi:hypothetical protein